jgi:hypothetical protein
MTLVGVSTSARIADVVILVVLALGLRSAAARLTRPSVPRVWRPRQRRVPRDAAPDDLAAVDRAVRTASASARTYHFGLRRTMQRLAARHLDANIAPADDSASAPEIRQLFADVPEPDDAREPGPSIDELERFVIALEHVVDA